MIRLIRECNNVHSVHNPITIGEDSDAVRYFCTECKRTYIIPKSINGAPEIKQYAKLFRRDILQGNDNLFYKVYPQYLR